MKWIITWLCVFTFQLSMQAQVPDFIDQIKSIAAMESKSNAVFSGQHTTRTANNYDVKYHRCEWKINPSVYYISGKVTTYFEPTEDGFSAIDFDFNANMITDSVKYHGSAATFTQQADNLLTIDLPAEVPVGNIDSISVYYQGTPIGSGFGSFIQSSHNGTPILWTLSEPFGAKDWWPCKQSLNDKIDSIDILVTCPQTYRDGSNGVLIAETQTGNSKTYHWKSHYPIAAYLVAVAVTNYSTYSDYATLTNGEQLEILNYVYPEDLATAQSLTPAIVPVIELYSMLTIDYPFANEKYGHCQFGWGGGMEHQTMTYCVAFDEWLIAHECAHQWFGDKVTCGSWEDIWLNEGFATFFEGLTQQYLYPGNWEGWKHSHRDYIVSEPDGSVLCTDTTDVGRIFDGRLSYSKGAFVLHMLRWQLGDSIFFEGIKQYLLDPDLAYNYAKTPDLKAHMEAVSGLDLTVFFDQWYYKEGYPTYNLSWYPFGNSVSVTVNQSQSDPSVSFFQMPLPVEFKDATHDTILVLNNTFAGQTFSVDPGFTPDEVIFDPELWILSGNDVVTEVDAPVRDNLMFSIFPNPVADEMSVTYSITNTLSDKLVITDVSGRVVKIVTNDKQLFQNTFEINISDLPVGVYFLRTTEGNKVVVKKFVKS
ncbi:MAG: T9SS type A sorting domain-containing protein [Chitinophagaceae bacterium]|nr:T9SS type A sorting domain-containing protein [Chitinophagaceae bacterium]